MRDAVDPGLQLARHGKVVHRRADHDHIGREELAHQALGNLILAALHIAQATRVGAGAETQRVDREVGRRILREVQMLDLRVRVQRLPLRHDALGELAGDRVAAERAGIDMQQFHYFLL